MDTPSPCAGCPSRCKTHKAKAKPKRGARFLVVAKGQSEGVIANGGHMHPKAEEMFLRHMQDNGFSEDDFVFFNSVRCAYDPKTYEAKDKREIEKRCRQHLEAVIRGMGPEVIIPLGAEASGAVAGRAVKITKARGVPEYSRHHDCFMLPMTDPMQVFIQPQHEPMFASDCKTLRRIVDHGYDLEAAEDEVMGQYELVTDLKFLVDEDPDMLSFDVETLGLRHADPKSKILTLQFCPEPGRAYIVPWDHPESPIGQRQKKKLRKQIRQLLCKPERQIVGQNVKFDLMMLWAKLGIRLRVSHDTLMQAAIVDENLQNKDLDTLTKIYVPEMAGYADSFNSKYDKSRMDLIPLDEIVDYGCGDTDASLRLHLALYPQIEEDARLWGHYHFVSIPGINAFASIERNGMLIDEDALDAFEVVLAEEVDEQYDSLIRQVPRSIKREHVEKDKKHPKGGLRFTRKEFVLDILFRHADGFKLRPVVYTKSTEKLEPSKRVPSTSSKDHLPYFFEDCPFTEELAAYVKNERLLSTNVRSFREEYMLDGHIYPIYSLWTAVTGRTASRDPNGQNFPKRGKSAKAYRAIFIPPPGYVQLEADLSQAELRISADMANDRTMIQIYNSGGDIHRRTACVVMGVTEHQFAQLPPEEQDLARFKAKAVNFGFIYGMGWRKFISYAKTQYGVEFTPDEAQRIRYEFFRLYSGLTRWHERTRQIAYEYGYVRSYDGRVRHLPMVYSEDEGIANEAMRQAINSPVQEFASSLGVMSLARIDQEIDPRYLRITGFVHDAIYAVVPERYVEWGAKTLKWYMESNPIEEWFGRKLKVPIIADVAFGPNGSKTWEMKGLDMDEPFDFDGLKDFDMDLPSQDVPPNNGEVELEEHLYIPEYCRAS